jgi:cytidine deaminase
LARELVQSALQARDRAYAPYSHFQVGAAIRSRSGQVFLGCNIENKAYSVVMCAERVAIFSAMAFGCRDFSHIALIADCEGPLVPCGGCLQVLAELAPDIVLAMANMSGAFRLSTVSELFPQLSEVNGLEAE